jgi:hypothetical protein
VSTLRVYYESIKREPKIRGIKKCRCDERLQTKTKEFTRLPYTTLVRFLLSERRNSLNFFFRTTCCQKVPWSSFFERLRIQSFFEGIKKLEETRSVRRCARDTKACHLKPFALRYAVRLLPNRAPGLKQNGELKAIVHAWVPAT